MFLHFETYALANPQKTPPSWEIRGRTWLPASYIYEAGSQVGIWESNILPVFGDLRAHMSQSVET